MSNIPLQRCSKCGTEYPATTEYFSLRTDTEKLRAQCRSCRTAWRHQHYEDNKEKILEQSRRWKRENRERRKETNRIWYEKNRETILEKGRQQYHANKEYNAQRGKRYRDTHKEQRKKARREHYINNRDHVRAQNSQWYQNNKEKRLEKGRQWRAANRDRTRILERTHRHTRRARLHSAAGKHTADDIQCQFRAQKGRCWWCGCKLKDGFHVDHLIPLSRGGSNSPENLVISCPSCNSSKGSKLPHEWCGRLF